MLVFGYTDQGSATLIMVEIPVDECCGTLISIAKNKHFTSPVHLYPPWVCVVIEERVGKNTAQKSVGTIDEQSFGHL